MPTLAGVGAALSGLGAVAGAFGRKSKPKYDDRRIQRLAEDARKAGISPLAALGVGPSAMGDYRYSRAGGLGDALKGAGGAMQELGMEQRRADIDKTRAEARKTDAEHNAVKLQLEKARLDIARQQLSQGAGTATAGPKGIYNTWVDNNPQSPTYGQTMLVPDQDYAEGGEGFLGAGASMYGLTGSSVMNQQVLPIDLSTVGRKAAEKWKKFWSPPRRSRRPVKRRGSRGTRRYAR